jgi:7-cyano-7-deazaguanine synthase
MDSVTLAAVLKHEGHQVIAVSFVYGSKHNRWEREAAKATCSWLKVELRCMDLITAFSGFRSNLLLTGGAIPEGHYNDSTMSQTVVPGRNLIFASILAGLAESLGADAIALGVHQGDHHIYPDCRPAFVDALREVVCCSTEGKVAVLSPFMHDDKASILLKGIPAGTPYHLTRTCYKDQPRSCGKCGSCRERLEAFERIGQKDPIDYE